MTIRTLVTVLSKVLLFVATGMLSSYPLFADEGDDLTKCYPVYTMADYDSQHPHLARDQSGLHYEFFDREDGAEWISPFGVWSIAQGIALAYRDNEWRNIGVILKSAQAGNVSSELLAFTEKVRKKINAITDQQIIQVLVDNDLLGGPFCHLDSPSETNAPEVRRTLRSEDDLLAFVRSKL